MTQYLLSVHGSADAATPTEAEIAKMYADVAEFNKSVQAAGIWVFAGGLEPIESATCVDASGSEPLITDGPYAETKEVLGGFWIIECDDLDGALRWAGAGSKACGAKVEVRPFQGM
jgi:hypothetical protein